MCENSISTTTDKAAPAFPSIAEASALFEQEFSNALRTAPLPVRRYLSGLSDKNTSGKKLRAQSLLACSVLETGEVPGAAAKLSAAVELLHLATLIHDDIIDDAPLRRGAASLQAQYGKRRAVICGDFLLCSSLKTAMSADSLPSQNSLAPILEELLLAADRLCMGELLQEENSGNLSLSCSSYLKIIRGKTAALFEICFWAGAVLSGSSPAECARFRRIGRYVGMGFQLCDDCADYEQDKKEAGKPTRRDYEQGVVTLPLIFALHECRTNSDTICPAFVTGNLSTAKALEVVMKSGGPAFTHALAGRYRKKALTLLAGLDISEKKRAAMLQIMEKCSAGAVFKKGD